MEALQAQGNSLRRIALAVRVRVSVQTQEDPHRHSIPARVSYQATDSTASSAVDDLASGPKGCGVEDHQGIGPVVAFRGIHDGDCGQVLEARHEIALSARVKLRI